MRQCARIFQGARKAMNSSGKLTCAFVLASVCSSAAICTNAPAASGWTDIAPITEFNQQPGAHGADHRSIAGSRLRRHDELLLHQ